MSGRIVRNLNRDRIKLEYELEGTRKINKSVVPCHSVYALGMERISSRLWQPSAAEVEQEAMAAQEATLRDTIKEHRLAANPVA